MSIRPSAHHPAAASPAAALGRLVTTERVTERLLDLIASARHPYDDLMADFLASAQATIGAPPADANLGLLAENLSNALVWHPDPDVAGDRWAVQGVDLLLRALNPGPSVKGIRAIHFSAVLNDTLRALDQHLCAMRYLPDVAERIAFGSRRITIRGRCDWRRAEQVRAARAQSNVTSWSAQGAMKACYRPDALKAVLDIWSTEESWPHADPLKPVYSTGEDLLTIAIGAMNAEALTGPVGVAAGVAMWRVLRDHPRTAGAFWRTLMQMPYPVASALTAVELLAAETPGPEAAQALEVLAGAKPSAWHIPDDLRARAAMRLQARRAPIEEMLQP